MSYSITTKDGITINNIPDDVAPDSQQLKDKVAAIRAAGQRPNNNQQIIQAEQQRLLQEQAEELSPLEAGVVAAGRGLTTIGRGLGIVDPESPIETQAFQALETESPIATTVGEVAGEAAPFLLPGGAIGNLGRISQRALASGALGAVEGGLIASGRGGDASQILQSSGIGGAVASTLELVLPVVGRIGSKIFRNITKRQPKAPLINASGQPSEEFVTALDKAGLSFDDVSAEANRLLQTGDVSDPVALTRRTFLESQGIVPTKAQVTGDASQFQAQQELVKTSGKVRRAIEGQESILASRFENAVTETGGSAVASNSSVVDFIADKAIDLDAGISAAYKSAREVAPTQKIVKVDNLAKAMKSVGGSDRLTGGLAGATKDILRNRGVIRDKTLKVSGRINAETAEGIRIELNALHNSLTPFGKGKLRDFKNALDLDVEKAVGKDIFGEARASKAKFEKDLSRAKINKFDTRKKELVRDILNNKVNPDRFLDDAVLSKTVRSTDLEQLKRYLLLDGNDAGNAAWNDLRAEAMERIRSVAIKEVAGEPALSRAGLEKVLSQFGRNKLRVLFSQEERKFLNDMLKVSKLREPVRGTALGKGPSAQAIGLLGRAVNRIPLINSVFGGAIDLIGTDIKGRASLALPSVTPLKPSAITQATPALIPVVTSREEQ